MTKEEAIKILKDFHDKSALFSVRTALETLHPELKESEDERIRKEIIAWLKNSEGQTLPIDRYNAALAWLEKQGEQKPAVEMKTPEESLGIDSETYNKIVDECIYGETKPANLEYSFKALPRLLEMIEPTDRAKAYCRKLRDSLVKEGYATDAKIVGECLKGMNGEKVPMATMEEKQDKQKSQRMISAEAKEAMYDKPAWSEEDEVKINRIVACLENLKVADNDILLKDVDWLKSLKPQNRWKPSDEQMVAIQEAMNIVGVLTTTGSKINSLYQDLKKLKS